MPFVLPRPAPGFVQAECDEFDREYRLEEDALGQLWTKFPGNTETSQVLLKVLALNKLYSTRINDKDVEPMARHISGLDLDPLLEKRSLEAVKQIANCPGLNVKYSFATKFCSWCTWRTMDAYPIYDGNVDRCLWCYRKQDGFAKFRREDLRCYEKFHNAIADFRACYELDAAIFTFKQLDKFLWRLGDQILKGRFGTDCP